jgi:hypothetical protein
MVIDNEQEIMHAAQAQAQAQEMYDFNNNNPYGSDSETSTASDDFVISPGERSDHDGYNRWKSPSGQVFVTAAGQSIELWDGVHCGKQVGSALSGAVTLDFSAIQ